MMVVTDWVCFLWTLHTQVLLILSRRGLDDGIGRERAGDKLFVWAADGIAGRAWGGWWWWW